MKKISIFFILSFIINIDLSAMENLITTYQMGLLEILKALLREILILNGLIRYLMKKEKNKNRHSCRSRY